MVVLQGGVGSRAILLAADRRPQIRELERCVESTDVLALVLVPSSWQGRGFGGLAALYELVRIGLVLIYRRVETVISTILFHLIVLHIYPSA